MADEPTGALDSATGKQIFETLKKLSIDKLVIVVSHDRDSAETYADRIIELADGVIVSDIINNKEDFDKIQQSTKDNPNKDFTLKKSKLPLKNSFKIGLSGLKNKKIRLILSVFLSFIAFTVFGLGITCTTFDQYTIHYNTLKMNGEKTIKVQAQMGFYESLTGDTSYPFLSSGFSNEQIQKIEQITGNKTMSLYVDDIDSRITFDFFDSLESEPTSNYYTTYLTNFMRVPDESTANLTAVASGSSIPDKDDFSKIAISDWVADSFVDFGLKDSSKPINSYEDLLGEKIVLEAGSDNLEFIISGVYKTDVDKNNYTKYKDKTNITGVDEKILDGRKNLVMSMGYVCSNFSVQNNEEGISQIALNPYGRSCWDMSVNGSGRQLLSFAYKLSSLNNETIHTVDGRTPDELQQNEIVVSASFLNTSLKTETEITNYFNALEPSSKTVTVSYCNKYVGTFVIAGIIFSENNSIYLSDSGFDAFLNAKNTTSNLYIDLNYHMFGKNAESSCYITFGLKSSEYDLSKLNIYWGAGNAPKTQLEDNEVILDASSIFGINAKNESEAKQKFDAMSKNMVFGRHFTWEDKISSGKEIKVVGIYFSDLSSWGCHLLSDEVFAYAQQLVSAPFSLMVKLSDNWSKNKELFDYLESSVQEENGIYTRMQPLTSISSLLDVADTWVYGLRNAFLYASIAFSVFASLLLMNYIGNSVADKKRTIGVLRAIGARRSDIFKIFLCQGLVIGLINFALSFLAVVIVSVVINSVLTLSVLNPGIIHALLMLALSLGVVTVATLVPTYKIAMKPPIDAINNR